MQLKTFSDKRLAALWTSDGTKGVKGLAPDMAKKIRLQMSALESASTTQQLATMKHWKVHELTPHHPGKWSMWVTGNYRLTFRLNPATGDVTDIDLKDYH